MIIGITGLSQTPDRRNRWCMGSGKDTVADLVLSREGWVKVALADAMKRFVRDLYSFTDEQLWGPSEMRNAPDKRYPREKHHWYEGDEHHPEIYCTDCGMLLKDYKNSKETPCYLSPRLVLLSLGNWGRKLYPRTWAPKVLDIAQALLKSQIYQNGELYAQNRFLPGWHGYSAQLGLLPVGLGPPNKGVLISDVRYREECLAIQEAGGKIIRVKRIQTEPPKVGVLSDSTERDLLTWGDDKFDYTLPNNRLEDLPAQVARMLEQLA